MDKQRPAAPATDQPASGTTTKTEEQSTVPPSTPLREEDRMPLNDYYSYHSVPFVRFVTNFQIINIYTARMEACVLRTASEPCQGTVTVILATALIQKISPSHHKKKISTTLKRRPSIHNNWISKGFPTSLWQYKALTNYQQMGCPFIVQLTD